MIRSLTVHNFRSLANVNVGFEELTLLVGPNGSGKSNVVDALRFVRDALSVTLPIAINQRGGMSAIRRVSRGHPRNFGFRVVLDLDQYGVQLAAEYSFEISTSARSDGFVVKQERCIVHKSDGTALRYDVRDGLLIGGSLSESRLRLVDQLALPFVANIGGDAEFFFVLEELTSMQFYSPTPDRIRELQNPADGRVLNSDGSNAASVIRELRRNHKESYEIICDLLSKIVPGVESVVDKSIGPKETIELYQHVNAGNPWRFEAGSMSDGTLRAFSGLVGSVSAGNPELADRRRA